MATDELIVEECGSSSTSFQAPYTHAPGFKTNTEVVNSRIISKDVYVDTDSTSYSQDNYLQDMQECIEVSSDHVAKDFEASELEVSVPSNYKLFLGKVIIYAKNKQPVMSIGVALDDTTVLTSASCLVSFGSDATMVKFRPYKDFHDEVAQAIYVQQVRFPVSSFQDIQQNQIYNYALLKLASPIIHLKEKFLPLRSTSMSGVEKFVLCGFDDTYNHMVNLDITQPIVYPSDNHFIHFGCANFMKRDEAILIAQTDLGYYFAGLHLPHQETFIKKSILFGADQQRHIQSMKWQEISCMQELAMNGDINAQYELGITYKIGRWLKKDSTLAFYWLRKAASHGHMLAQYNVGLMYDDGETNYRNDKAAARWYYKPATHGHANAKCRYGLLHLEGQGIKQDNKLAFAWILQAAEEEDAEAQVILGWMYKHGCGVEKNDELAFIWYYKAAIQGRKDAQFNLGLMYETRNDVQQNYQYASYWYQEAADQGDAEALCNLGLLFQKGLGVAQDDIKAVECYEKAAIQGNISAQCNLAWMFARGRGVQKNYHDAFYWHQKAANQGDPQAWHIVMMYPDVLRYQQWIESL